MTGGCTAAPRYIVRAHWASFKHGEPVLLARKSPKHQRVFFRVEARIEIVSRRGGRKTSRDREAPLGIERNDHSGIIPPRLVRVKRWRNEAVLR